MDSAPHISYPSTKNRLTDASPPNHRSSIQPVWGAVISLAFGDPCHTSQPPSLAPATLLGTPAQLLVNATLSLPLLPEEAEEGWTASESPHELLPVYSGEHPDLLHRGMICRMPQEGAERIIGSDPPALIHIFKTRCKSRARTITRNPTHLAQHFFRPLPSCRILRTIQAFLTYLFYLFKSENTNVIRKT